MSAKKRAVFLDRDGTLNEDPGYLGQASGLRLLPEVGPGLQLWKAHGFLLVVVSNQSGVGRGFFSEESLKQVHLRLDELLEPWGVQIDRYALCLHRPDQNCECRKPKPKLLLDSAQDLNIDLQQSFMVGDRVTDLEAGRAAGCQGSILVKTGEGEKIAGLLRPDEAGFVAASLLEAARWTLYLG